MGTLFRQALTNVIKAFCSEVEKAGYYAGVYVSLSWLSFSLYNSALLAVFAKHSSRCGIPRQTGTSFVSGISPDAHKSPGTSLMPSPPSSEPKKILQQLVFHFQPLDFIVLFLFCRYVSFSRSSPAPGKDSCFHFPYPPVIPFYPSFYHVFVFESELLRYFSICFPCRFHLQYFFFYCLYVRILP